MDLAEKNDIMIYKMIIALGNQLRNTKDSDDFFPETDRISVFDLDGTLFCETDPIYIDWNMYLYRVLEDTS